MLASYLARPADGEPCLTGYGAAVHPHDLVSFELVVSGFSDPAASRDGWRTRAWRPWLRERLSLPVRVAFPWEGRLAAGTLLDLIDGGEHGLLGRVVVRGEELAVGLSLLEATDLRHAAPPVLREYRAGRAAR